MIDKTTIDSIYEAANIVEVIGEFITLRKRGVNYLGHCPFHNERTPSFTVSPSKSIYKCFGCGKSGNVVRFVMDHENISYTEALRYLAKRYGIYIEESAPSDTQLAERNKQEELQILTNFAGAWLSEQLNKNPEGISIGHSYLRERGFTEGIIARFNLGYNPMGRSTFSQAALKNGYKRNTLIESGLSVERNEVLYDRFSSRIMFPIHSITGQILGFGGRTMQKDANIAKYLNSPETLLYQKSKILYGIYQARKAITQNDSCYLVEGYTDVISMHQCGIENVVASSGTSLTIEQIRLLRRFTQNLTLLFDSDNAGIKASLRGIDLILSEGMNVKICLLPEGDDPDSFAKKSRATQVIEYINKNETDFIKFKARFILDKKNDDPIKKATIVSEIVQSIACIPSAITRSVYINECSRMLDIPENILYAETKKLRKELDRKEIGSSQFLPHTTKEGIPEQSNNHAATYTRSNELAVTETELIRFMLENGDRAVFSVSKAEDDVDEDRFMTIAEYVVEELERDEIMPVDETLLTIFSIYSQAIKKNTPLSRFYFTHNPDITISTKVAEILAPGHTLSKIWERENNNYVVEEIQLATATQKIVNEYKWRRLKDLQQTYSQRLNNPSLKEEEALLIINRLNNINQLKQLLSNEHGLRSIF